MASRRLRSRAGSYRNTRRGEGFALASNLRIPIQSPSTTDPIWTPSGHDSNPSVASATRHRHLSVGDYGSSLQRSVRRVPVMPPEVIRTLPFGTASSCSQRSAPGHRLAPWTARQERLSSARTGRRWRPLSDADEASSAARTPRPKRTVAARGRFLHRARLKRTNDRRQRGRKDRVNPHVPRVRRHRKAPVPRYANQCEKPPFGRRDTVSSCRDPRERPMSVQIRNRTPSPSEGLSQPVVAAHRPRWRADAAGSSGG